MSTGGYKITDQSAIHFVTFTVVEWVDVFTRKEYRDIVVQSLCYCQQEKGLIIYAWCLMSNHLHLLARAQHNNFSDILRDFKKFTSKQIAQAIEGHTRESRKDWMLSIFKATGQQNSRNSSCQFWRQDNQPKECYSDTFIRQKLNYIHENPVESGIVSKAEEYLYSSARDHWLGKNVGLIDITFM